MYNFYKTNIYPTPIYEIDCSDLVDDTIKVFEQTKFSDDNPYVSDSFYCLNKNPDLIVEFEKRVNYVLSEHFYEVPFKMTTSWFTCAPQNNPIHIHNHVNSIWSSTFYFFDNCSPLHFIKGKNPIYVPFGSTDPTVMMTGTIAVSAKKGIMLVFPSNVEHYISANQTEFTRYSVAMNYMPDGACNYYDSSFKYTHSENGTNYSQLATPLKKRAKKKSQTTSTPTSKGTTEPL